MPFSHSINLILVPKSVSYAVHAATLMPRVLLNRGLKNKKLKRIVKENTVTALIIPPVV